MAGQLSGCQAKIKDNSLAFIYRIITLAWKIISVYKTLFARYACKKKNLALVKPGLF
jgi:hypothetical protein